MRVVIALPSRNLGKANIMPIRSIIIYFSLGGKLRTHLEFVCAETWCAKILVDLAY